MKKGYIFVGFQFLFLLLIFVTGPNIPENIFLLIAFAIGVFIGLYAIWNMRVSKFRTNPEVADGSKLVTNGIYKYIRHPMYLGLIIVSLALLLDFFTITRLAFVVLLVINQIYKLTYEEKLLEKHFVEYKNYKESSNKLIPFIY